MGIAVIGTVFVDIKGFPYNTYLPTGRNAGSVEFIHGGVARNVVEDIANLELRPSFIGLVDNNGTGEEVKRKLENHKVDTKYVRSVPDSMGMWLAVFDNSGDLAGSVSKRPDQKELERLLDEEGDEIFKNADSVVIEIDLGKEIIKRSIALAEKYRKKIFAVVANMTLAAERRDFMKSMDCVICNEEEAGILFVGAPSMRSSAAAGASSPRIPSRSRTRRAPETPSARESPPALPTAGLWARLWR